VGWSRGAGQLEGSFVQALSIAQRSATLLRLLVFCACRIEVARNDSAVPADTMGRANDIDVQLS